MIRAVLFALLTIGAIIAFPEENRWLCFAGAVALGLVDGARRLAKIKRLSFDETDFALGALLAYGALSLLWTDNPDGAYQTLIIGAACFALRRYVASMPRVFLIVIVFAICVAAWGALILRSFLPTVDSWGFGNPGYAAEALLLCCPFPLALRGRARLAFIGPWVATGIATASVGNKGSLIVPFAIGIVAMIASLWWAARRSLRLLMIGLLAWTVAIVAAGYVLWQPLYLGNHVMVRAEMDMNAAFMIIDRPIFGHGLGSFIETYPLYKEAHGDLMPFVDQRFRSYVTEAEALHNDPLQFVTEMGLLGLELLGFLAWGLWKGAQGRLKDPIVLSGALALLTVGAESLIEYPLQRAATIFLAVIAAAFVTHGRRRWTVNVPLAWCWAPIPALLAASIVFAALRQTQSEEAMAFALRPTMDPVASFNLMAWAHRLNPLNRRILVAMPSILERALHSPSGAVVSHQMIVELFAQVDRVGRFNTSALVSRAQFLLDTTGGADPSFPGILADLDRGSSRVAAVYAIEGRYLIVQGRFAEALAAVREGEKYAGNVSAFAGADQAITDNLRVLHAYAATHISDGKGE